MRIEKRERNRTKTEQKIEKVRSWAWKSNTASAFNEPIGIRFTASALWPLSPPRIFAISQSPSWIWQTRASFSLWRRLEAAWSRSPFYLWTWAFRRFHPRIEASAISCPSDGFVRFSARMLGPRKSGSIPWRFLCQKLHSLPCPFSYSPKALSPFFSTFSTFAPTFLSSTSLLFSSIFVFYYFHSLSIFSLRTPQARTFYPFIIIIIIIIIIITW